MKSAAIVLVLFVAIATADDGCPMRAVIMAGLSKCKESMNPSKETLELVMKGEGDDNKDVECFAACLWKEAGLVDSTKLNISKLETFLQSAKEVNQAKAQKFVSMLKDCKGVAEVSNDACTVAGAYHKCMKSRKPSK